MPRLTTWAEVLKYPIAFLGNLLVPDDCRVCGLPLRNLNRIPVCESCLAQAEPFGTDYMCVQCRTPFSNDRPLDEEGRCLACRMGVRSFDAAYSYGEYDGVMRRLIHLFKYNQVSSLEDFFVPRLMTALPRQAEFDWVTAVPLHWRRYWSRGYNQSAHLAKGLGRRIGVPYAKLLWRERSTTAQSRLSGSARRRNLAGAFSVHERDRERVRDRRILLIDDVFTTGSTVEACARALKRAGARQVTVLTLARVDRRASVEPLPRARAALSTS